MRIFHKLLLILPAVPIVVAYLYINIQIGSYSFESNKQMTAVFADTGWIPKWMPDTANNIYVSIDSYENNVWIVFFFSPLDDFYSECRLLDKSDLQLPDLKWTDSFDASLHPAFVRDLVVAIHQKGIKFYQCCESSRDSERADSCNKIQDNRILAIDLNLSQGYVWRYWY